ncbi:MAG: hypothetical protein KDA55_23220, partial [Planctomycetales bacterium]|nr:hypothetical protein [Planctomycetales bacterium]
TSSQRLGASERQMRLPSLGASSDDESGRWERALESTEHWIGRHPTMCVGAALLFGVMVGWLVKRR